MSENESEALMTIFQAKVDGCQCGSITNITGTLATIL